MANFIQVANRVTSPRGRAVVADILTYSKLFNAFNQFSGFELDTTIANYLPFAVSAVSQTRAIGSSYTYSYAAPPSAQTITQAIVGAAVPIDKTYYRDAEITGAKIANWFEKQIKRTAISYAKEMDEHLMKGTGVEGAVKGLKTILNGTDDIPGFSNTTGVLNAATYSTVSSAKTLDLRFTENTFEKEGTAFMELLQNTLAGMDNPQMLIVNKTMAARLKTIGKKLNLVTELTNNLLGGYMLNNLQVVVLPETAIPNNEPDDTATPVTATTSVYILSPAEMQLSLVTNGFDYAEFDYLEAKEAGLEKWEMGIAWKIENADAVKRIRNIRV